MAPLAAGYWHHGAGIGRWPHGGVLAGPDLGSQMSGIVGSLL
jgi:hypothetical protein